MQVLKNEKWLRFLTLTTQSNINLERLNSLEEVTNNYVLNYVEKTLQALSSFKLSEQQTYILEEVLKWSETAKVGLRHQRAAWMKKGYNLFAHNIGSAQIYLEETNESEERIKLIVYTLILTHGLIGQSIRGEVSLTDSKPLYELVKNKIIIPDELIQIMTALNYCIITAVDPEIWLRIHAEVKEAIENIARGRLDQGISIKERIKRLRKTSRVNGENFNSEYERVFHTEVITKSITKLLSGIDLWYVEAALYDFSFEEFTKIMIIISNGIDFMKIKHISFEHFMSELYYQHNGKKRVNIYKKRVIEKYLSKLTIEAILNGKFETNLHVAHEISLKPQLDDTAFFTFKFSPAGSKLIDFCTEAEKSDVLYEKAIILLFDLFELRKDKYDRFYEEEAYLETMNQTIDYKKIILEHIVGDSIIDIGPGGGALMDLIEAHYPEKKVIGVDIAENVLNALKKKKQIEGKKWDVIYGDALNLLDYIEKGSVDTIIFCSILHELFSYITYKGKKFNHETLGAAFKSAFKVLKKGGRIIIRDGVMTEPSSQKRIIKFLSDEGMAVLKQYAKDFKGRIISFEVVGQNEVLMPVNDAMEFLYTYTWGEKSYNHEVNEQFGYFAPTEFRDYITSILGEEADIIEFKHFLQEGYTTALSQKIAFYDEQRVEIRLPDSTCLVVIQKK